MTRLLERGISVFGWVLAACGHPHYLCEDYPAHRHLPAHLVLWRPLGSR